MTPAGLTRLKLDEGARLKVYNDATGRPIVKSAGGGNPTIGFGRNLAGKGITDDEAEYLLRNDLAERWDRIVRTFPWADAIDPVWQDVMLMVDFNTGNVADFPKMVDYLRTGEPALAARELLDSRAARELPARYTRMANALTTAQWAMPLDA